MPRFALAFLLVFSVAACKTKNRFTGAPSTPQPKVGQIGDTSVQVLWTTDDPASSFVEFGASQNYATTAGDGTQVTLHLVTLSSLPPFGYYHYRVHSLDNRGNSLYSFDQTFQTKGVAQPPLGDNYEATIAWQAQTFTDSQAVTSVQASNLQAHGGASSLRLNVNLVADDPANHLQKGETLLLFRDLPAASAMDFADLSVPTISAWIFAPTGASGDPSAKNGIQLFVKDVFFRSQYGTFVNITENAWFLVTMDVGNLSNPHTDPGFDPSLVSLGGVKIGGGTGSTATYAGPIFVDDVVWRP